MLLCHVGAKGKVWQSDVQKVFFFKAAITIVAWLLNASLTIIIIADIFILNTPWKV